MRDCYIAASNVLGSEPRSSYRKLVARLLHPETFSGLSSLRPFSSVLVLVLAPCSKSNQQTCSELAYYSPNREPDHLPLH